jgi:hypothetical protein
MDPTQNAIEKSKQTPGLCPEAVTLLQLAAEAQRTGVMPDLPAGSEECPICGDPACIGNDCSAHDEADPLDCTHCSGRGHVLGEDCAWCDGTGEG